MRLRLSCWRKWHLVEGFRPHCNFKMKNSNYNVLFLYSNHEHSMLKFICVILFNAIHNNFESAINKVSWTKLYMLDDHYECTIVYSCDIFLWLFWSKTGPKYTLNSSKSLMGGFSPVPHWGLQAAPRPPASEE